MGENDPKALDGEKSPVRLKVERHLRRLMIPGVLGLEACKGTGQVVCDPMPGPIDTSSGANNDQQFAVPPPVRDAGAPPPPVVCDPMPPPPDEPGKGPVPKRGKKPAPPPPVVCDPMPAPPPTQK